MNLDLSFQFDISLRPHVNMPEPLKESISNYMENEGTETVAAGIRDIISKYCLDNGLPDVIHDSTIKKDVKKGVLELDPNQDKESQISDFFTSLGKKKSVEMKKNLSNRGLVDNLKIEIDTLTESINPDSSDEDKSICAFKILDLKLKFEAARYDSDLSETTNNILFKIEEFRRIHPNDSSVDIDRVQREFSRVTNVVNQTTSELKRLNTLDEKDFKDLDYESRGKYLLHVKSELEKAEGFLAEELGSIKKKLVGILTKKLGLGDHISTVLS